MESADLYDVLSRLTTEETTISALSTATGIEKACIMGALNALIPFGAIQITGESVRVASQLAEYFLKSYSEFLRTKAVITEDWYRHGAECSAPDLLFERGVCFLKLLEQRRSAQSAAAPLRRQSIVKAIVKALSEDDEPHFLMLENEQSHTLQFIGGGVRPSEDPEVALQREILEELPRISLKYRKDYNLTRLTPSPIIERFVSPTWGTYSEYAVQYYHLKIFSKLPLSGSLCWVALRELLNGVTDDGIRTVPPPEMIQPLEHDLLEALPSVSGKISPPKPVSFSSLEPHSSHQSHENFFVQPATFLGKGTNNVNYWQCFVIMPYSQEWSTAVEGIVTDLCSEAGLTTVIAKYMDGRFIPGDIWLGITGSGLIIADLTGANPNVAYEIGLADVLEKVRTEFSLTVLAYNLRRVVNLVAMPRLLAALG